MGGKLQLLFLSLFGAVVFESAWWLTGGGYYCSLLIFLALMCYCYGRQMANLKLLAANTKSNLISLYREEKRSILLIVSYFCIKFGLLALYPQGERSNGSLIIFTVLFIFIFLVPSILSGIKLYTTAALDRCKPVISTSKRTSYQSWRSKLHSCLKVFTSWKRSILLCSILAFALYLYDSNITALLRFLGKGIPCFPLQPPSKDFDIPSDLLTIAYSWHTVFPSYQPSAVVKTFIAVGRELGEVCNLLPMLIGTYTLCQIFLPPKNSLIKKALFASIAGVVLGGVSSGSLKLLFHRYRPNAYGNPYMWTGPGMTFVNHLKFSKLDMSFPAGHTTVTSAVATCWYVFLVLSFKHSCLSPGINLFLLLCFYLNPVLVLLSRVSECYHWTSDTTFGV